MQTYGRKQKGKGEMGEGTEGREGRRNRGTEGTEGTEVSGVVVRRESGEGEDEQRIDIYGFYFLLTFSSFRNEAYDRLRYYSFLYLLIQCLIFVSFFFFF